MASIIKLHFPFAILLGLSSLPLQAHAQFEDCTLVWKSSRSVLGTNKPSLACRLSPVGNIFGIRDRGKFTKLSAKDFLRYAHQPRSPLHRKTVRQIKTRYSELKATCGEQSAAVFLTSQFNPGDCQSISPTETPLSSPTATATATTSPTVTATATNTATPTPAPDSSLNLSTSNYDFGTIGPGETQYASIVIRAQQGSPYILGIDLSSSNGITLLSNNEVIQRGGVPCDGSLSRFCVVEARLDASNPGTKSASVRIRFTDDGAPNPQPQGSTSVSLTGVVESGAVSQTNAFRTISIRALAQAAGLTPVAYLQNQFDKIAPSSYDSNDPFLFDTYTAAADSDWRNNWANSVFDFSGLAWDSHQDGTAVTRCHVVYARHYQRGSGTIAFHRKDGTLWTSNIAAGASRSFPIAGDYSYDVTVARINPCLPADWTVYPLINASDNFSTSDLGGAPYINTHYNVADSIRRMSVTKIGSLSTLQLFGAFSNIVPSYMEVTAQVGDSGNPSFLFLNGELVIVSTFTFGGYGGGGPYYGSSVQQQMLSDAIAALP